MFNVGKSSSSLLFLAIVVAIIGLLVIGGGLNGFLNWVSPGLGDQFNRGSDTLGDAGKNLCGKEMDNVFDVSEICDAPAAAAKELQKAASDIEQTGQNAENAITRWWNQTANWWKEKLK